jgi:hypothetical protein
MPQSASSRRSKRRPAGTALAGSDEQAKVTLAAKDERPPLTRAAALAALSSPESRSRILEMEYWSREPGVIDLIRTLVGMPEQARAAVEAFFAFAHEPAAIAADVDALGRLILTSPHVGRSMAIMQFCSDNEEPETSCRPN